MKISVKNIFITALLIALPFMTVSATAYSNGYAITASDAVSSTQSQDNTDGRCVSCIIADILPKMPADNVSEYDAMMQELASTGKIGVELLAMKLSPAGEGQNSSVEYALNGLVAYVSAEGREDLATEVRRGLGSAIASCKDKTNQAFLMTLLQLIGTADDAGVYAKYLDDEFLNPFAISGLIAIPCDEDFVLSLIKKSKAPDAGLAYLAAKKGVTDSPKSPKSVDEVEEARDLLNSEYSHIRINALYTLIHSGKVSPQELVLDALKDSDREYRVAALKEAEEFADETLYDSITALTPSLGNEAKADVITWFGDNHVTSQTGLVVEGTTSGDFAVATAAIKAAGKLGGDDAMKALATCLDGSLGKDAVTALISFKGDVTDVVMTALDGSPKTQILALELASSRHVTASVPKVYALTASLDGEVKAAAYNALAGVCSYKDYNALCNLLDTCESEYTPAVQAAIIASVQGLSDEDIAGLKEAAYNGSDMAFLALANIRADLTGDLLKLAAQNGQWTDAALSRVCVLMGDYVPASERVGIICQGFELQPSAKTQNELLVCLGDSHDPSGIEIAMEYINSEETAESAAYAIKTIAAKNPSLIAEIEDVRTALAKARDVYIILSDDDADAGYAVDEIDSLLSKF